MVFEQGHYWRAFTTTFVHADYKHLGHNALFFTSLSVLLHNYFGNFIYPFLSLFMGGVINLIVLAIYPPEIYLVGISGVVYFMGALWLVMYLFIERTLPLKKRIIVATGLFLIFLAPEAVIKKEVSYLAHGVGFALGIPVGILFYYFHRKEIRSQEVWVETAPEPEWTEELTIPPQDTLLAPDELERRE